MAEVGYRRRLILDEPGERPDRVRLLAEASPDTHRVGGCAVQPATRDAGAGGAVT